MTSSRKTRLLTFFDRVWNAGDEAAVPGLVADAYVIHHDPRDPWHGLSLDHAAFCGRLRESRAPFRDQAFTVRRMIEDGDTIAVAWTWRGTQQAPIGGYATLGRVIVMTGITLYDFGRDDRLTGHWQEVDRLGVYSQLAA
jgi:predicted ester cyclase